MCVCLLYMYMFCMGLFTVCEYVFTQVGVQFRRLPTGQICTVEGGY